MPVQIDELEVVVPSAESAAAAPNNPAATPGPAWTAELARKLMEQIRIAHERAERLRAD